MESKGIKDGADPSGRAVYKTWVCGLSLAYSVGSNPAGGMDVCLFKSCVLSGRSLVQRSTTECGMSECDQMQQ